MLLQAPTRNQDLTFPLPHYHFKLLQSQDTFPYWNRYYGFPWLNLKKKKSLICISAVPYILSTFLQKTEVVLLQIYTLREWSPNNAGEGVFNLPSDLVKTKRQWLYWRLNSLKEHPQRGPELCTIRKMILTGKMWGQMVSWRSELSWRNTADWGDPALYRILGFSDSKGDKSSFTSGNNYCYSEILQA